MGYMTGVSLALAVALLASFSRLDRDRAFYPAVMIAIASYYVLFAVMGGSAQAVVTESFVAAAFLIVSIAGFKWSQWLVVLALAAHGLFDLVHSHLIENPGVPTWWPDFCSAYDLMAAAGLAGKRVFEQIAVTAPTEIIQSSETAIE